VPVVLPHALPARATLASENVFVMTDTRAVHQDIRPLRIAILNLMPTKINTETQLLRLLGNTPLQVEISLLRLASHEAKNTSSEHLEAFYVTFDEVREQKFDGLVITGAPVEKLPFEDVDYWPELCTVLDWSVDNVFSTMYVCWGAQAALYHHYGVKKYPLQAKMFGVFSHRLARTEPQIVRGFDEVFLAPHSRHTEIRAEDIGSTQGLAVLAESDAAGVYLAATDDMRRIFVTGHPEYEWDTLREEYERDVALGLDQPPPTNYFPDDDPTREPVMNWRSHAFLLYANWLNYYVYQRTPFSLQAIPDHCDPPD